MKASELKVVFDEAAKISDGELASYIPELSKVDPESFALSVCTASGELISFGDTEQAFTLQSISKVLTYAFAMESISEEEIRTRVGVEPSGDEFDSIIKLDRYKRPFNPMVNSGAIAITDLLISRFGKKAFESSMAYFESFVGESLKVNTRVFESERQTGERNRAIGHLLKNYGLIENSVDEVLDLYFRHCSIEVTTNQLSRVGEKLAGEVLHSHTSSRFSKNKNLRNLLSVMLTCGMYNYSGQWAYEVGMPAKSGVSGGILAVAPGRLGLAAFSPRIDDKGSSRRALEACKILANKYKFHLFDPKD